MTNKNPLFRILITFILISVTTAACNAAPALTPTATLPIDAPVPSATATEAPTEIPPTSTETPDPNKPSDAVGDKDPVYGYFTKKAEDGVTTLYWIVNPENPKATGWFTNGIENPYFHGGIPVIGNTGTDYPEMMALRVFNKVGLNAPHLSHKDHSTRDGLPSFSSAFHTALINRIALETGVKPDRNDVARMLINSDISITVKDENGSEHKMPINNSVVVNIFLVDKADFPEEVGSILKDRQSKTTFEIGSDGTVTSVNILVASKTGTDLNSYTDADLDALYLVPFFNVIGASTKDVSALARDAIQKPAHFEFIRDSSVNP